MQHGESSEVGSDALDARVPRTALDALAGDPQFPDRGHTMARMVKDAGLPLTICGIVQDERYFAEQVAPHVDGDQVVFLGSVGPKRRAEVLGASTALLHPIAFDEPFGLSVVESMVCGTPVVAYARGSMPEVVDEGVTGFVVHTVEQAVDAVTRASGLDRAGCRARARQRFGADRMVTDYLAVYDDLTRQPHR